MHSVAVYKTYVNDQVAKLCTKLANPLLHIFAVASLICQQAKAHWQFTFSKVAKKIFLSCLNILHEISPELTWLNNLT